MCQAIWVRRLPQWQRRPATNATQSTWETAMGTALEKDAEAFERLLPELMKTDPGRFVLIRAADRIGVYETYESALAEGYKRFGFEAFFVKEIAPERTSVFFMRSNAQACPT